MKIAEFLRRMQDRDRYDWIVLDPTGVYAIDFGPECKWDPPVETHLTWDAIEANDWHVLEAQLCGGKDVDQITRTTGYFSKVSGWNPGKTGELKDRARVKVE